MDPRLALSLLAVYVIWGSTYLVMAIVVAEIPPLLMASLRFVAAGLVMLLVAMRSGVPFPGAREWLRVVPIGALLFVGGNGFVAISEQSVSSGGAAVVCAMMPLWVGVLSAITGSRVVPAGHAPAGLDFLGEKPTRREWASLLLGFAGVVVLLGGPALAGEPLHVVLILCAPICWALGSILSRRLPKTAATSNAVMLPAMQMLAGGAVLAGLAAATGERLPLHASADAWLALVYLTAFGSIIGFTAYSWLLRNARPAVATSYAYVNPILAVMIGAMLYGEPLGASTIVANAMIVAAVVMALRKRR